MESWLMGFPDEEARDDSDKLRVYGEKIELIAEKMEG